MTRVALFLSISTAALMTGAASAQDAAPAGSTAETGDVVRVIGSPIRDSQAASIAQKRNADNIIDVIAADTIGRFPDQNAADALGRLPGLAIQRDQGQARYINFRGMPERWTTVAFDGIEVLGAEGGRVPRFDSIPTVIVGSIEAIKTLTPSLPPSPAACPRRTRLRPSPAFTGRCPARSRTGSLPSSTCWRLAASPPPSTARPARTAPAWLRP